jgi:threonine aldolase
MALTPQQRQQLRKDCTLVLPDFAMPTPAQEFEQLARWCEAHAVQHDHYGSGAFVEGFEHKIATLLGKPTAVYMPSGVMAQLAAVRVWSEAAKLQRFGMHPTCHLATHEEEAYAALMHCHGVPLGDRLRPLLAADLQACTQPLACLIVELPLSEVGYQLPSWDELEQLKAAAQQRQLPLHMDGARLWESAACYQRSYADICAGFASVYVSLYKGIGAFSGAVLAGGEDFIAQARLWRRRMGGTLYHLSPLVASAAMRLDERLALMPALYQRTLTLATGLAALPGLKVSPAVPHTNMLDLYFDAPAHDVLHARDLIAQRSGCWLLGGLRATAVPGWSKANLYVGDQLLGADNERVLPLFAQMCTLMKAAGSAG